MISRGDTLKSDTAKLTISPGKHSIYIRSPFYLQEHSLLFIYELSSIYIRTHFYLYTEPLLFIYGAHSIYSRSPFYLYTYSHCFLNREIELSS